MKNIIIFGTGNCYNHYKERFSQCNILALVDNCREKQGLFIDGKRVISIDDIVYYKYDYIMILVYKYDDIYKQLSQMGIEKTKIITIDPNGKFSEFRKIKKSINNHTADILMISHEMNMRGAPLMLFEMAKILKKNYYNIEIATTEKGVLEEYYYKENIAIITFDDFLFSQEEIVHYFGKYKLIIVNTLALSNLISELVFANVNTIWWLHEEWSAYQILSIDKQINFKWEKLFIYGVGNRAINAFYDFFGTEKHVDNFQWGIEDCHKEKKEENRTEKPIFAVVGPVCRIKGQDILLEMAEKYSSFFSYIKILLIGNINETDREKFEKYSCFEICGEVEHSKIMELYNGIDIVLSTSRNDTMPVVLIEAMMNKKVCVTSDGTGVADYIKNYYNGIVFERNNPEDLINKLQWVVKNKDKWKTIGENGYLLYKEKFSIEKFEKNILFITQKHLETV